jgi:hypothetical protein
MKQEVEATMLKRAENKDQLRALLSNDTCKLFFQKHKDQLTRVFNYYYSQTYVKLGQHKLEKISLRQLKKFTMDFELVPLVISGKELSTMVMSSIYDNKENIRSDTTHLDYDGFVEALARMVIKKSEIFTKIFENFRDNQPKSSQEVVEGVDQGQLEKVSTFFFYKSTETTRACQ